MIDGRSGEVLWSDSDVYEDLLLRNLAAPGVAKQMLKHMP